MNSNGSDQFVNTGAHAVLEFADEMAKKGLYDATTGRNLRTALKSLLTVLGDDDSAEPREVLTNIDSIAERWARVNKSNPDTMKTYKQRASALLEDFIKFMESPGSFKGRGGSTSSRRERKDDRKPATNDNPVQRAHETGLNTFRMPNGKCVRYCVPEDFTIEDLRRLVFHLMPMTSDFDPMKPGGGLPPIAPAT